jgi:hypothetical protein
MQGVLDANALNNATSFGTYTRLTRVSTGSTGAVKSEGKSVEPGILRLDHPAGAWGFSTDGELRRELRG